MRLLRLCGKKKEKVMKRFVLGILVVILLAGCSNPFFPPLKVKDNRTELQKIIDEIAENMISVSVPVGVAFTMGPDIWNNSATVQVSFTQSFYMSKYLVTQDQYEAVMEANPSYFHGGDGREPEADEVQGKRPVEMVNWYHAIAFCNRLSILEGLTPVYSVDGISNTDADAWLHYEVPTSSTAAWNAVTPNWTANGYRLPTDAQWEYAAKGGNGSPGNFTYSGSNDIDDVAWYSGNSGDNGTSTNRKTHEVGLKAPNGLGIYDMSGNVWEWCWDRWGNYPSEPVTDYYGAAAGAGRVGRGGSWDSSAEITQSVSRSNGVPDYGGSSIGFRLVRP